MSTNELDPPLTVPRPQLSAHEHAHAAQHARRWWILAVLAIAQLMVVLDGTVVNIALPSAQRDLGFDNTERQWIVTAYSLAFGSLLLIGGRLADLIGRKNVFLIGLFGFAAASAVGGAATTFGMLVAARAVQGGFAALLAPAALALLTTTFVDPEERGRAFGIFGAIAGGGLALGLLLGGLLTEYLSWRWCMYINIAFAVVAIVGGVILLARHVSDKRPKIDIPGTIVVSAGLFALVYGFSNASTAKDGWHSPVTIGFLVAAGILIAAFVIIQLRTTHALLPLRILLDRNRGGAFIAMLLSAVGMFGVFLFLTYYMQVNLGYTAVSTGVAFLPMCGVLILTSVAGSAVLSRRVSPRIMIPAGLAIGAVAMIMLTRIGTTSDYTKDLLPSLLLFGIGLGLIFSTGMSIATLGVRVEDTGVASATVNTVQQVGGSIGTALLNTLATAAATAYIAAHLPHNIPAAAAAAHLSVAKYTAMIQSNASVHSYTTAFWWSAAFFGAGAIITAVVLRSGVPEALRIGNESSGAEPAIMH
jgi:EmrB/QacA subfamily drug resistance transporter